MKKFGIKVLKFILIPIRLPLKTLKIIYLLLKKIMEL